MLKAFKPKAMKTVPDRFVFDGEKEILERTVTHGWMRQWLKWLLWYHTMLMTYDPSLDALMKAPISAVSWRRSEFKPQWFKFGLIWEVYEMGAGPWSDGYCPPHYVLDRGREDGEIWCILGGESVYHRSYWFTTFGIKRELGVRMERVSKERDSSAMESDRYRY